jgi:3-hydroxyisobutyrate dehydrogenase
MRQPVSVTVVGLGQIGGGVATRAATCGFDVTGVDPRPASIDGVRTVTALEEAGPSQVVVLCLHPESAEAVIEQIASGTTYPETVIDTGTGDPEQARQFHATLRCAGVEYVEAPVSGGPSAADRGTLSLFVGADDDLSLSAQAVLDALGTARHMGAVGAGRAAKIVNNAVVGAAFAAVAEAYVLAQRLGLNAESLGGALEAGSADCWVIREAWPRMIEGDFSPGGTISMHLRDLEFATALADEVDLATPINDAVIAQFRRGVAAGLSASAQHALVKISDLP